jgi:hypothetical protein
MDPTKGSVRPQVDFANGERHAARVPPMCDVFGICPGLEDNSARRIEDGVITISRSVGVAIFTVAMFFTGDRTLSLRASTCFLLLLHLFQVVVRAGKFLLPEAAKGFKPLSDILERDGHERARTPLCIARTHNEARSFEYIEVLRDRWLT